MKKTGSTWKDTQADKDQIPKPTQASHKFKKENKVLPLGIQPSGEHLAGNIPTAGC